MLQCVHDSYSEYHMLLMMALLHSDEFDSDELMRSLPRPFYVDYHLPNYLALSSVLVSSISCCSPSDAMSAAVKGKPTRTGYSHGVMPKTDI